MTQRILEDFNRFDMAYILAEEGDIVYSRHLAVKHRRERDYRRKLANKEK